MRTLPEKPHCLVFILSLVGMMVWLAPPLGAFHAPGDPDAGKNIFMESCQHCHGALGKGNGPLAQSFSPPPKDLTSNSTQSLTDDELRKVMIEGRKGTAMAGFGGDLKDAQLIDLVAFIRSLIR